jgi:hypothetical protein
MQYVLGNMLNGGGGLNPDGLALDLQFALDKTLTARRGPTPVFTRGSTGTFVGSNGLIQTAAVNSPRFDHASAGVCRGLLIEESRSNVALYSGAWVGGTGWSLAQATSVVSGTGPDGNNAYEVADDSTANVHGILNSGSTTGTGATSVVSGTTYTGSVFLKKIAGSVDWVQVTMGVGGFGAAQYANFNLSTGQVGNFAGLASGTSPRIEAFANGWYRCSISVTATTTTTTSFSVAIYSTNNTNATTRAPVYNGNPANKFLAAMAQFETGSFATSYIPTTTASVVRSADVCSITGANFTSFYNQSEGSVLSNCIFQGPSVSPQNQFVYDFNDTTVANRFRLLRENSGGGSSFLNTSNNISDVTINGSGANGFTTGVATKVAVGVKLNDFILYKDNALVGSDTSANMPIALTALNIGGPRSGVSGNHLNGTIAAIRYYKKRLPNAKLAQLTV